MAADSESPVGGTPAIDRAVAILDYLAEVRMDASLSEIAMALDLNKSTCFNILKSLSRAGIVERDSRVPLYRLGPKLVALGNASRRNFSYRELVENEVTPLLDKYNAVLVLGQLLPDDSGILIIDHLSKADADDLAASVGEIRPLTVPAMGRAVLATRPYSKAVSFMSETSVGNAAGLDELQKDLEEVRRRGFAVSLEEYQRGVSAVATVVTGPEGNVELILCLVGSPDTFPTKKVMEAGKDLHDKAVSLEAALSEATPAYALSAAR
ncbi:MAG: IclR family transcriptional regulator [Solirubrobacterales bacterium]